nr:XF1762 family protein [uncultured Dysosmobacter sp.]
MLEIRPITLRDANSFVAQHHRHNQPTNGHKWSIACYDGDRLCGVAIAGQPIARKLDDGLTIEIRRVCTDGTYNACSILYGACARVARDMGYKRVITYTLASEGGSSLRASGFVNCGETGGTSWDTPSRPREVEQITLFGVERKYPAEKKVRWEKKYKRKEER